MLHIIRAHMQQVGPEIQSPHNACSVHLMLSFTARVWKTLLPRGAHNTALYVETCSLLGLPRPASFYKQRRCQFFVFGLVSSSFPNFCDTRSTQLLTSSHRCNIMIMMRQYFQKTPPIPFLAFSCIYTHTYTHV